MNRLFLLRHCETVNNAENLTQDNNLDLPITLGASESFIKYLDSEGLRQLSNKVVIVSSKSKRTLQTTEILAHKFIDYNDECSLCSYSIEQLREVNFGDFSSKHETEVLDGFLTMSLYRSIIQHSEQYEFPNGENSKDINTRVQHVIRRLAGLSKKYTDYDIVVVGHNRFFRHLLVALNYWQCSTMFDTKFEHGKLMLIDTNNLNIQL